MLFSRCSCDSNLVHCSSCNLVLRRWAPSTRYEYMRVAASQCSATPTVNSTADDGATSHVCSKNTWVQKLKVNICRYGKTLDLHNVLFHQSKVFKTHVENCEKFKFALNVL